VFLLDDLSTSVLQSILSRFSTEKIRSMSAAVQFSMQYVPQDDFDEAAHGGDRLLRVYVSRVSSTGIDSPLVLPDQRDKWEKFAWENKGTKLCAQILAHETLNFS
jgi:hypothetical protein